MGLPNLGDLHEKYDGLCQRLDDLTAALSKLPQNDQTHSRQMREWEPFRVWDGGSTVSNAATIGGLGSNLVPAPNGWEARVHRITLSIGGASTGATAIFYQGGVDTSVIFDFVSSLYIGSPAVNVADYNSPVYFLNGEPITVVIASAAAGTNRIDVRVEGYRRQI